jgi:hypothetical protein
MREFTGVYDKHKQPIFVGDKLKIYPGFGCEWKAQEGIVWVDDSITWEHFSIKGKYRILRWDLLFIDMECSCEVLR